jgi:hypothetical protein
MNNYLRKVAYLSAAVLFYGGIGVIQAAPLSGAEKDITGYFSPDVQRKFNLYADSEDASLVWYVPKDGTVALLGSATNPVPRFSASSVIPTTGIFAGQPLAYIGGSFDTSPFPADLALLNSEAASNSFRIAAAPAKKTTTSFLLAGLLNHDGRPNINCVTLTATINNPITGPVEVEIPNCSVTFDDGTVRDVNVMQNFIALPPTGFSSVSTSIPFQAQLTPDYSQIAAMKMNSGESWDDILSTAVDWELDTRALTKTARITIDWNQTFKQASTYFAIHNNACLDVEVSTFFRSLVRDGKGVLVEYYNGTDWTPIGPNDADFLAVVKAVEDTIRKDIVTEFQTYSQSQLGTVNRSPSSSFFTLRANYEKQIVRINETRYVNYNPGAPVANARTTVGVMCLTGGFGLPVRWNTADAACNALLVQ